MPYDDDAEERQPIDGSAILAFRILKNVRIVGVLPSMFKGMQRSYEEITLYLKRSMDLRLMLTFLGTCKSIKMFNQSYEKDEITALHEHFRTNQLPVQINIACFDTRAFRT
uniref:Helitron_like_N domain-containing protein n=1 Tax=Caenorhabditis tropicalis TaxID=1561998 RepID=A0A1I7UTI3_9PELO